MNQPIYVVDGARTPFLKARSKPGPFAASDLAVQAGRALLTRMPFSPPELDEVILGCASPSPDEVNIGRVVALRMGCGLKVPGWTVMRNCASGMQALDSAITNIRGGRSSLVLAGGVDALSRAPLLYSDKMVLWFANFSTARSLGAKASAFFKLRPAEMLTPVIGIMKGLTDPMVGLLMGQTAENLAYRFGITRRDMDEFSAQSHRRVLAAQKTGHFDGEIVTLFDRDGKVYPADDGVREDSTPENLAKLKPFFDRKYGNVTAGNSSQITDGAAWLVLASEEAVAKHKLPVLGTIVDSEWAGLDAALGQVATDKLNVDGGAIALGHPVGASGARIVLHLLNTLKRNGGRRGIASICIGGGQGGAMLVERACVGRGGDERIAALETRAR